jgi:hypothetical protein
MRVFYLRVHVNGAPPLSDNQSRGRGCRSSTAPPPAPTQKREMRASATALLHHAAACRSTGGSLARSGVSCVRTMASGVGRGRGDGGAAKANAADGAAAADQPKVR